MAKQQKDGRSLGSDAGVLMPIHGRALTFHLGKRANNTVFACCETGRRSWNSQRHPPRPSYQTRKSQRMIWTYRIGTFQSRFPRSQPPMVQVSQPFWRWDEGDPYRRCACWRVLRQNDEAACFDVLTQAHMRITSEKFSRPSQIWDGFISSTLCHMSAPLRG